MKFVEFFINMALLKNIVFINRFYGSKIPDVTSIEDLSTESTGLITITAEYIK